MTSPSNKQSSAMNYTENTYRKEFYESLENHVSGENTVEVHYRTGKVFEHDMDSKSHS